MRGMLNTYKGLPKEVYVLFISKIITCIGSFVHPLMTLILTEKVGLSTGEAGGFISMLVILQGPSVILGGQLADRLGRKKTIMIFQGLGVIFFTICGFMETNIYLAYCMVIAASMFAAAAPALDALNADITTEENRKASYSLIYLGVNIGYAIGPALGGLLYKDYLSLIFIGDAITTLLALLLVFKFIKEPDREEIKIRENAMDEDDEKGTFEILKERPYIIFFAIAMLTFQFGYSQFGFIVPLQLNGLFTENGAQYFGMLCALNALLVVILTPIVVSMTKRVEALKLMAAGGVMYAGAFLIFNQSNAIWIFVLAVAVLTLGEVFIATNSGTFIANHTPIAYRGRISGIIPLIYGVGSAIGPALMGGVLEDNPLSVAWFMVSAIVFVGGGVMYFNKFVLKKSLNSAVEVEKVLEKVN